MLDLKWLAENLDYARKRTRDRGDTYNDVDFDGLARLLSKRKDLIHQAESAKHEQKVAQEAMKTVTKGSEDFRTLITELKSLKAKAKSFEEDRKAVVAELDALLLHIPNICQESVPLGQNEASNVQLRAWGTPREFDFEIQDHVTVGEGLSGLDFMRAGKVAGSRFVFLRNGLARLSRVLVDFMLDLHTTQHRYEEILPPFLVNAASMVGTGQLPKFAEDSFKTDHYYLIPTAEVPVTNFYRDEILAESELPIRFTAYTPCFRREAGSYGADTRGMIRQHQFEKVELVQFVHPNKSDAALDAVVTNAETVLKQLEIPYRVMNLCAGDIGFSAGKCYDLEVWLPSQGRYREISSCSNFGAFQARRANIRFRPDGGGKPQFVHTLNGSALAIGRTLVAILENFQNADGSMTIPPVLRERMGAERLLPPT